MIYLLPNIFTTLNIFCGFFSIISSINEDLEKASWAIFLAMVFDIFDGRIARFFKKTSNFGLEYDSLCDLVSFGVAPSLLIYQFILKDFGKAGWLACFLYTTCVALRLARFNVRASSGLSYFEGLPSPAGAAILASVVLFFTKIFITLSYINWIILILVYVVSYLLVSPIQYPSFKEIKIKKAQTFYFLVFFVIGFTIVASHPSTTLLVIITFYILLGPFLFFKNTGLKIIKKFNRKN